MQLCPAAAVGLLGGIQEQSGGECPGLTGRGGDCGMLSMRALVCGGIMSSNSKKGTEQGKQMANERNT